MTPDPSKFLALLRFSGPADRLYGLKRQTDAERYQEWLNIQGGRIGEL
jgi:hypothetical protein